MLILLENLASAIENVSIINNMLIEDIQLCKVVFVLIPTTSFISLLLSLISKYNGGFKKIHYLSYLKKRFVNDCI